MTGSIRRRSARLCTGVRRRPGGLLPAVLIVLATSIAVPPAVGQSSTGTALRDTGVSAGKGGARTEVFMTGFVENNEYLGRPVDFLVMKDGSLLVSDDHAGAIYRISYGK